MKQKHMVKNKGEFWHLSAEEYLEPSQTSTMQLFFRKKAPSYMFGRVLNTSLVR